VCGILGYIGGFSDEGETFRRALSSISHRGPDDSGVYRDRDVWLGHRRLSIIDLTQGGHQPMIDRESGAVIIFNGEIYNYIELRDQLIAKGHAIHTRTDTEVLLKSFLQWGSECLNKLNGMWAFAVWLPNKNEIFFARDRFGVKPFYFRKDANNFSFSSEPKALLSLFKESRNVNASSLYQFLALGSLYTENESFYKDISILPPAHCGEYDLETKNISIWRYWNYPTEQIDPKNNIDSIAEFETIFDSSVKLRLRSDVNVGFTLSGGLDSTAILASSMRHSPTKYSCFTSVYDGEHRGETKWASIAAEKYNIKPIEVSAPKKDWIDTLRKIAWHMDAPGYSPAVYPVWFIMKEARSRGIPVLLEGQGADEELGGYPQYGVLDLLEKFRQLRSSPGYKNTNDVRETFVSLIRTFTLRWTLLWLIRESFPSSIYFYRKKYGLESIIKPEFSNDVLAKNQLSGWAKPHLKAKSINARLLHDHSRDILPGLLHYGDAISMAHGIESRLPFMDFRLVEWIFSQAASVKISKGETKWVLRQYLKRVGQDKIANRTDKLGYPTPVDLWLAENNGALPKDILLDGSSAIREFCDIRQIEKLICKHVKGATGYANNVYRLVSTELWLQECIRSTG